MTIEIASFPHRQVEVTNAQARGFDDIIFWTTQNNGPLFSLCENLRVANQGIAPVLIFNGYGAKPAASTAIEKRPTLTMAC